MSIIIQSLVKILLLLLVSYSALAQDQGLESLINKYEPYYKARSTKMAVLIKKNDSFESAAVGMEEDADQKVFCIGSATKTFTAVLILQEMERGNLKLDDSIGKFLNPIMNIPGDLKIEQLLRHESGLGQTVGRGLDGYDPHNENVFRQSIYKDIKPQDTSKIGIHEYNNTNYILLGEILEKINDAPYDKLLEDRIFKVCDMKQTYAYVSKNIPNLLHPYTMEGEDLHEKINYKYFKDRVFAAGSIASTLEDMAQFYQNLYETENLMKKSSFDLMKDFREGNYGLGLMKRTINKTVFIGHGGNIEGYSFRNFYDSETGDFVMMYWNKGWHAFKNSLREDLANYLKDQSVKNFRSNIIEEFRPFLGDYILKGPDLELSITEINGIVNLHMQGYTFPLVSVKEGILYDGTSGINFSMKNKNPNQLIFKQGKNELIAERIATQ